MADGKEPPSFDTWRLVHEWSLYVDPDPTLPPDKAIKRKTPRAGDPADPFWLGYQRGYINSKGLAQGTAISFFEQSVIFKQWGLAPRTMNEVEDNGKIFAVLDQGGRWLTYAQRDYQVVITAVATKHALRVEAGRLRIFRRSDKFLELVSTIKR